MVPYPYYGTTLISKTNLKTSEYWHHYLWTVNTYALLFNHPYQRITQFGTETKKKLRFWTSNDLKCPPNLSRVAMSRQEIHIQTSSKNISIIVSHCPKDSIGNYSQHDIQADNFARNLLGKHSHHLIGMWNILNFCFNRAPSYKH